MSASAGYGITHHAVDRYIERVLPGASRAQARAALVEDLRDAAPLRERTLTGQERLKLRSGDVAIVKRDPLTRERVVVTVAPQGRGIGGTEEAQRMLEWLAERHQEWAGTFSEDPLAERDLAREAASWPKADVAEARALAAEMARVAQSLAAKAQAKAKTDDAKARERFLAAGAKPLGEAEREHYVRLLAIKDRSHRETVARMEAHHLASTEGMRRANAKLRARIHNEGWIGPGAVFERVANAIATAALMHMAGFVPEGER